MSIKAILFDLDGTLLPMDQKVFTKTYFKHLVQKLAPLGFEPNQLIESIWSGVSAIAKNNGKKPNQEVFWETLHKIYGDKITVEYFDEFYENEFDKIQEVCDVNSKAKKVVDYAKSRGLKLTVATNPIFPQIAVKKRIVWTGLNPDDFELITTYENSTYSKPNLNYYQEIANNIGVDVGDCLMVGNDVQEDMVAGQLGMKVFLLMDNLINKDNVDVNQYPNGNFDDLVNYINKIC